MAPELIHNPVSPYSKQEFGGPCCGCWGFSVFGLLKFIVTEFSNLYTAVDTPAIAA
jgi:hypothetical protein